MQYWSGLLGQHYPTSKGWMLEHAIRKVRTSDSATTESRQKEWTAFVEKKKKKKNG
jgi:hypothetical protein